MRRRDPHDRAVEVPEELLGHDRRDLGAPTAEPRVLFDGHEPAGLRDLTQDRLRVERHERAHVDDRRVDAVLLLQDLGRLERARHHERERADRDVFALAHDVRLTERHDVLAVRHLALSRVERLLLEKQDRVVVADRGRHHPLHVGRERRRSAGSLRRL